MRKMMALSAAVVSLGMLVSYAFADEVTNPGAVTQMKVSGIVSKVQSGLVHVKTSWGSMTFTLPGSETLKVGEEVEMQVNNNNAVIDFYRKGEPALPVGIFPGRWPIRLEIDVKSSSGRPKERKLLTSRMITVELNESGTVIDLWKS